MTDVQGFKNWIKVAALSAIGGGIAGASSAAINPQLYQFPKDFGSGKLWEYFLEGALLTFGALLLKSPIGVKLLGTFKESQAQLAESKQAVEGAKSDLKSTIAQTPPTTPPKNKS